MTSAPSASRSRLQRLEVAGPGLEVGLAHVAVQEGGDLAEEAAGPERDPPLRGHRLPQAPEAGLLAARRALSSRKTWVRM